MSEPFIRAIEIEKTYRRHKVLCVSKLEVGCGHTTLVGENGSGKTTLLKLLARVIPPSRGRLVWSESLSGKRIAFVPQVGGLYPTLTIKENFELNAGLYNVALESYAGTIQRLGVERFLHQPAQTLSGGFQKLAAVVCALSIAPYGLFIDEPFSGLDSNHSDILLEELERPRSHLEFLVTTDHAIREGFNVQNVLKL